MQAIYAWQFTDATVTELEAQFGEAEQMRKGDRGYFSVCLKGVVRGCPALDSLFEPYLDRRIDQLDGVERAILRIGTFELK
jgi:N utilization substance protein B